MKFLNQDNVSAAKRGREDREEAESKVNGGGVKTALLSMGNLPKPGRHESNVFRVIQDPHTLTELATLALYG